jgi:hypothetical protein
MTHQARQAAIDHLADAISALAGSPEAYDIMRLLAGLLASLVERGER